MHTGTDLEKVSECLGALTAGKLPSESQLEDILRVVLKNELLDDQVFGGYGPLSERGRQVLRDSREVVEAILQIGMEKNCKQILCTSIYTSNTL